MPAPTAMTGQPSSRRAVLSLPREHGAYLTLAGAIAGGVLLAPARLPAAAAGVMLAASFLARGPLERRAAGLRWRAGDVPLLLGCALAAGAGVHVAARGDLGLELALLALALVMPLGGWLVRRLGQLRAERFEVVGMAALGGSAGLVGFTGGAGLALALTAALLLAVHAAASVPLVRALLRPRERAQGRREIMLTGLVVVAVAAAVAFGAGAVGAGGVGAGGALASRVLALALLPRAVDVVLQLVVQPVGKVSAARVGVRELVLLVLALLGLGLGGRL
ncbi:MAG: hypothetical protein IT370_08465 [Deltaproteobacteria bacterium]|nr:hypothetical protein [Deltaproteobacteria bacterium]